METHWVCWIEVWEKRFCLLLTLKWTFTCNRVILHCGIAAFTLLKDLPPQLHSYDFSLRELQKSGQRQTLHIIMWRMRNKKKKIYNCRSETNFVSIHLYPAAQYKPLSVDSAVSTVCSHTCSLFFLFSQAHSHFAHTFSFFQLIVYHSPLSAVPSVFGFAPLRSRGWWPWIFH